MKSALCLGLLLAVTSCGEAAIESEEGPEQSADSIRWRCGNGVCGPRESCTTCPQDCGRCPVPDAGALAPDASSPPGTCVLDGTQKFFGMFFSGAGADIENIEPLVAGTPRPDRLTVVQDYKMPGESIESIVAAHDKGNVVHLNLMPVSNSWNTTLEQQVHTLGAALGGELRARQGTIPGILITIGPEMNGYWTDYGCTGADPGQVAHAAEFVQLHNNIEGALRAEIQAAGLPRSRLRIVWGPNASPGPGENNPCTYPQYWPGWDHVDFVGYSDYSFAGAYRSGEQIVQTASQLLQSTGARLDDPAYYGKVLILQTGMDYGQSGHDRGAWLTGLFTAVRAEPHLSGLILFQSPDYGPKDRPEPRLRWLDYVTLAPLEGLAELKSEIANGSTFAQQVSFLFCN